jgi:hypothetical protein
MDLPIRAKLRLQATIDAEQSAQDTLSAVTRRLSELNHAMVTAPRSEIANMEATVTSLRGKPTPRSANTRQPPTSMQKQVLGVLPSSECLA